LALLRAGTKIVYSNTTAREAGALRAGEVVKANRLVFVPGCFHHLVLRRQGKETGNLVQWRFVRLVAMDVGKTQGETYSKME
jgi:hypothetical protein